MTWKIAIAFVVGGAAGALAAGWYFKNHALELTAGGITDKIFGEGSKAGKLVSGLAHTVEGLAS